MSKKNVSENRLFEIFSYLRSVAKEGIDWKKAMNDMNLTEDELLAIISRDDMKLPQSKQDELKRNQLRGKK